MKKKILFVLPSFGIGGTTVSVRNLISVLDKSKYDITIWCLNDYGILKWMYEGIPQIKPNFIARSLALSSWKNEKKIVRKILAAFIRKIAHRNIIREKLVDYSINHCIDCNKYDTIVSCQEGHTSYVVSRIESKNRIGWVRCDYNEYYKSRNCIKESFYSKYNHIVCVAEKTRDNFIKIYPEYKDKTTCIYNPQDSKLIISQADINDYDSRFNSKPNSIVILSVGRLSKVKRFDKIPSIAKKIKDKGIDFVWYIIGSGEEEQKITNEIDKYQAHEYVKMLGAKANPHYYIKRADLYVCLSSTEACPRVVNEAKILSTPVVSTDFPTIYEYIEDNINGKISSIENIPDAIIEMLDNKKLYSKIKKEINSFYFDNKSIIKQLENIF